MLELSRRQTVVRLQLRRTGFRTDGRQTIVSNGKTPNHRVYKYELLFRILLINRIYRPPRH